MQCGHAYLKLSNTTRPGYFVIITVAEGSTQYICGGSHTFVTYGERARNMLVKALMMREISIPPNSVLIVHGFVKHAGPEWSKPHDL